MAIIGTAHIRVKLLSDKVGGDIKKSVEQSLSSTKRDADKAGQKLGGDIGKGIDKGIKSSTKKIGDDLVKAIEPSGRRSGLSFVKGFNNAIKSFIPNIPFIGAGARGESAGGSFGKSLILGITVSVADGAGEIGAGILGSVGNALKSVAGKVGEAASAVGTAVTDSVSASLTGGLRTALLNPIVLTGVVAAALSLAAVFVTAFLGAIAAVAGVGAVGAALLFLLKKDPAFKLAGEQAGQDLVQGLTTALEPLRGSLMGVLRSGTDALLGVLRGVNLKPLKNVANQLSGAFQKMEPVVTRIFDALIKGAEEFLPTILAIGEVVGEGIARAFELLSENADAVRIALKFLGDIVTLLVRGFLKFLFMSIQFLKALDFINEKVKSVIKFFGLLGDEADKATDQVTGFATVEGLEKFATDIEGLGSAFDGAGSAAGKAAKDGFDPVALSLEGQKKAFEDVITAHQNYINEFSTQVDSSIAINKALISTNKAIQENGRNWDLRTEKGIDNFETFDKAIRDTATALAKDVQNQRISGTEAGKIFRARVAEIQKIGGATGPAKKALDDLAKNIGNFPDDPIKVQIEIGIAAAQANIEKVLQGFEDIKKGVKNVNTAVAAKFSPGGGANAAGGLIRGPGTGTSDSINTNVSNGEFIIKASSVKSIGANMLAAMNRLGRIPTAGFATGGPIPTVVAADQPAGGSGMTSGERAVVKALTNLSRTSGATTVNVFIGNEKLNDMIDTRIEENDDKTAQQLVTGRRKI